jgi:hypothetical protein
MTDFEPRLREALQRKAGAAPKPTPFQGETMRRIRIRRGVQAAAFGMSLLLAVAGVATAVHLARTDSPPPAHRGEKVGPYTHWLYVLDPTNRGYRSSAVLALDPESREVVRRFPAGYDPQMALSPDGSRVFVVSTLMPEGTNSYREVIDEFDTSAGERVSRTSLPELDGTNKSRTGHKVPVFNPDFTTSMDGSRIYIGEQTIRRGPVRARTFVGTFDTSANELLANSVEIPDCNTRVLLPGASPEQLTVACSATSEHATVPERNFLYFLTISDDGSATEPHRLDLPGSNGADAFYENLAWAASSPDGETIYCVTRDGHVFVVDVATERVESEADLGIQAGFTVQMPKVLVSQEGGTMYVGTGFGSSVVDATAVVAYDTRTWDQVASVDALHHYFGLALGPAGTGLYAPTLQFPHGQNKGGASLQVFDGRTLRQLGSIRHVGDSPALVEVPRLGR